MKLRTLIDGYVLDCQARNLSPGTINRAYAPPLRELCDWLGDPDVADIETCDLREFTIFQQGRNRFSTGHHPWMEEVEDSPLSPYTIHRYTRVIRTLFNWAVSEGVLSENPAANLKRPRLPDEGIRILSEEEIKTVLQAAKAMSYRDYVIVFLMLDSGIRREELVELTLDDVDTATGLVVVRKGKGDKFRQVRVGNACRKVLMRYVHVHRGPGKTDALFLSEKGKPLSYEAIGGLFRHLSQRTGIRVYAHLLRHTYATAFVRRTPNAIMLARALGHSEIDMAKKYVHFIEGEPPEEDMFSPMDYLLSKS